MPIPGNEEPGAFSGQQQVQKQQSINFSSAIPIKKRRFPIIQPSSPPPEEKPLISEDHDSKKKQDCSFPDEGQSLSDARNTASPGNSDVSKTSAIPVKKEVAPTNLQLGQSNVDVFVSKPLEAKPSTSLGPLDDVGSKKDILRNEKSSEREVPESFIAAQTANVKQEIISEQTEGKSPLELSTGKMNVELSLGPEGPLVPPLQHQNSEAVFHKSGKSDSSLLSLALHEEKLVLRDNNDGSRVCANRSNWDLNTTMDVWEGSTSSNAFAHRLVDIGGFNKTNSCHNDNSSLTTVSTVGLSLNKGKCILDGQISSSSNVSIQSSQQCKADDSLGLRLAMPYMDTSMAHSSLSDNLVSTSISPNLNLKQVQLSVVNVNRTVKSEPVDDNSKHDCSIGSCSSSNMELLKYSSVKKEFVNNPSLETAKQSSIGPEKLIDRRSIKSEVVQDRNQESCKSEDAATLQSVGRAMQHQESCASSSALPVPLMHQNPCPSRLPTCSELTASGDLSNQSEQSFHSEELHHNDMPDEPIASMVSELVSEDNDELRPHKVGNLSVGDLDKSELTRVDEHMHELCQYSELAANDEEKVNISQEMLEEDSFGSDSESQQNCAANTICDKEDEEYEDGEVREPIQHSAGEDPIVEGKNTEKLELVESDSQNLHSFDPIPDQNNASDLEAKDSVKHNLDETHADPNKDCVGNCHEPNSEDNSLQKLSYKALEVVDEKRSFRLTPDKQLDLLGKDVQESLGKEVPGDVPTDGSQGIAVELGDNATDKVVKENCSGKNDSTLSKVKASLNGHDAVKDSSNVGNKSRIINLPRASVVTTPCKSKSIPNRLLTSRSGERYSDLDGEMHPRGNRDDFYTGGSNKFVKDRFHDQSLRNSRPNFMLGKGRMSGRFGSLRSEWDSEHDFASETSYGPSDYRVIRRKHASSISDVELECDGFGVPQDGTALGGNRRNTMNDEFPSVRRTSLRRLSSGDRDGPVTRGIQMLHRIPRNMSPRQCSAEAGSDMIGLRHDDKFMRHLSDDIVDPVYGRPQAMYDELDSQLVRGNRNFSTLQRKGYPRIRSKSPVRSRTRSPGPWSSPRRRSPNGLPELTQHRSPALYRTGRMRSPDRACFGDEMVARRRGSPSYIGRHTNDLRDVDSGREHVHPRSADSNRRSSPGRVFPRSARRADALDSREMGDDDEYMNGPFLSNKFHDLRAEGSVDERRKFIERRGPLRSFRPRYNSENDNFRFHLNDGPRPYRFCPDADTEFVERGNMREREFDGRTKHQPLVVSRRIRNIEEQQDGSYRPVERAWHDDGFNDPRVKRRRF